MAETPTIALVAMGGHAFIKGDEAGSFDDHERNAATITERLMTLIDRDYRLIITHGNGPQVGNLLLQTESAREKAPEMPLDVLVAMTEGSLGYVLQQALLNQFRRRQNRRFVVTMITQVLVDENDPAFHEPSKPIGPFMSKEVAERRRDRDGWKIVEDPQRGGWRRLVPSPRPTRVIQRDMIRESAEAGHVVVAAGGGGIPVKLNADGNYDGVEAVVDKDLTSAVLAANVGAELLIILTAEPNVYTDFGKPTQQRLSAVTLEEVEALHAQGHFPPGSMGPKVEAVIHFLRHGGRRALITDPRSLPDAMEGAAGTHIIGRL